MSRRAESREQVEMAMTTGIGNEIMVLRMKELLACSDHET